MSDRLLIRALLCGLGTGLLRPAPGTWGSLPPVALALGLVLLVGPHWTIDATLTLNAVLFASVCLRFGAEAEKFWGGKDPGQVVADEFAGQSIALLFLPWQALTDSRAIVHDMTLAAVAFVAFRACDVLKPPPARQLQRLRGGLGILIDDLFAGVYALVITQGIVRFVL